MDQYIVHSDGKLREEVLESIFHSLIFFTPDD